MEKILNRNVLQKPHPQTYPKDRNMYRPHVRVSSALYDPQNPFHASTVQGPRKLVAWLNGEERAIDAKVAG